MLLERLGLAVFLAQLLHVPRRHEAERGRVLILVVGRRLDAVVHHRHRVQPRVVVPPGNGATL